MVKGRTGQLPQHTYKDIVMTNSSINAKTLYVNNATNWYVVGLDGSAKHILFHEVPSAVRDQYRSTDCLIAYDGVDALLIPNAAAEVVALTRMAPRYYKARTELVSLKDALSSAEAQRTLLQQKLEKAEAAKKRAEALNRDDFLSGFACGAVLLGLVSLFVGAALVVDTDAAEEPQEGLPPESGTKVLFLVLERGTEAASTAAA